MHKQYIFLFRSLRQLFAWLHFHTIPHSAMFIVHGWNSSPFPILKHIILLRDAFIWLQNRFHYCQRFVQNALYPMRSIQYVDERVGKKTTRHTPWMSVTYSILCFSVMSSCTACVCVVCACLAEWKLIESCGELDNGRFLTIFKPYIIYQLNCIHVFIHSAFKTWQLKGNAWI